jgi:hypothetical protein
MNATTQFDEFLARFGGRSAVAEITGVKPNAVTQWRKAGVPFRVWFDLIDAAEKRGIHGVDRNFLGSMRAQALVDGGV